ncbi:MAG: hypothetical protein GX958_01615, partial [Desulfitobacterium sp.]|nr:hypothetical protein [Desulfitobacterium sp.]
MNAEIRERIEMINRGEVPEGYKKTKAGIIPEDWEVKRLGELSSRIIDGTHSTPKYTDSGVQFYSVENITNNDFENTKFISKEEHIQLSKRCPVEKGDVLMTRIGSIGDTKLIDWDVKASIYVSLALIKLNTNVLPEYVYMYTKGENFKREIISRSLLKAVPQKINLGDIANVKILVPNKWLEQQKIAQILSTWDKALELKEKLIDDKKKQKKGFMQKLLTKDVRLPGFDGEWEEVRLD